jgi:hypothetical protein
LPSKYVNISIESKDSKQNNLMKTKVVFFIFLAGIAVLSTLVSNGQDPRWKWARSAGNATVVSTETDTLGNVVSIGSFNSSLLGFETTLVAGSPFADAHSMYLIKHNPSGGILWAQSVFGNNPGSAVEPIKVVVNEYGDIAVLCKLDNVNELKLGKITLPFKDSFNKLLLIKLNKTGRVLWFRLLEARSQEIAEIYGTGLLLDDSGNVFCTGSFSADSLVTGKDYLPSDKANTLLFVARFNSIGALDWLRTCDADKSGTGSQINSRFMALSPDGIYIAGDYNGRSEYYLGVSTLPADTTGSGFVAKISFAGDWLWAKHVSGSAVEFIEGIGTDLTGDVYLTGFFNSSFMVLDTSVRMNSSGAFDQFIGKLKPDGSLAWIKSIDVQLLSHLPPGKNSIINTSFPGNLNLVTLYMGKTVLTNIDTRPNAMEGTRDLLILKLDNTTGNIRWVRTGNSMGDDWFSSVAFDRFGSVYLLGSIAAPLIYDTLSVTDLTGNGGFYLIKINQLGEIRYVSPNFNADNGNITGNQIIADSFGNVYLFGSFSGVDNKIGELAVDNPENSGSFISKYSYTADLSGKVLNPDGSPMPGGKVILFGFTRFQRSPLSDSTLINLNGEYILKDIPYGRYIIYAYPRSAHRPNLVPTYYPSGSNWQEATPVIVLQSEPIAGIDILLKEKPVKPGTAALGGMVFESDTTSIFKSTLNIMAKPVKKADVVLVGKAKAMDNVIGYTTSDDNGNFVFTDIPDGGYTVIVDIPGMPHESYYDVTVTGGQLIMNLDYLVGEETITAQNEINRIPPSAFTSEEAIIYPNPCSGILRIRNPGFSSGKMQMEIYDLSGICVYRNAWEINDETKTLNISEISEGLYAIILRNGSSVNYFKLLIAE